MFHRKEQEEQIGFIILMCCLLSLDIDQTVSFLCSTRCKKLEVDFRFTLSGNWYGYVCCKKGEVSSTCF